MSEQNTSLLQDAPAVVRSQACAQRPAQPWYRQAFQESYLDLYRHRDLTEAVQAVRFLKRTLVLHPDHRLLDLCCGPGRHLFLLQQLVRGAIGLDLSRALLSRARAHCQSDALSETAPIVPPPLIQGNMKRLPLTDDSMDRVVNLFTSFGYFESETDNMTVLREITRVLRPSEGMLALDHINREALLSNLAPRSERTLPDGRTIIEQRRWDAQTARVIKQVETHERDGQAHHWCESVRVYHPEELEAMLSEAGLAPLARHGDYDGSDWSPDSPRLILIARRQPVMND